MQATPAPSRESSRSSAAAEAFGSTVKDPQEEINRRTRLAALALLSGKFGAIELKVECPRGTISAAARQYLGDPTRFDRKVKNAMTALLAELVVGEMMRTQVEIGDDVETVKGDDLLIPLYLGQHNYPDRAREQAQCQGVLQVQSLSAVVLITFCRCCLSR